MPLTVHPRLRYAKALSVLALALAAALPAFAQSGATVKVGNELKKAAGTVVSLQSGDVACHMTLKDDQGATFKEMADFEICSQKPSIIGKRVALGYSVSKVMSDECQGDPQCKKTRTVTLVSSAKPMDAAGAAKAPAGNGAVPAAAGGHPCSAAAIKQAEKLLKFHDAEDQPRAVGVSKTAKMLGTIKSPVGNAKFDVLEVEGGIYKAQFRLRMIYGQIPGTCVLVGQEILELTNL